jgi:hypothetical protein
MHRNGNIAVSSKLYSSFVILTVFKNCFLVSVSVQFTYVESYPDEGPIIELKSLEGLTDSHIDSLQEFLNEKVKYYSSTCTTSPLQMSQYTYYYQKQSPPIRTVEVSSVGGMNLFWNDPISNELTTK